MEIEIREGRELDWDLLDQVEELHRRIWGFADRGPCYPARLYRVQARIGGTPLVAVAGGRSVAFLLGFAAYDREGPYIWSQIMGVHPDWRGRGLASRLKWRQREFALAAGVERIEWTYDPLEAGNGRLNLSVLGGLGVAYEREVYGGVTGPRFSLPADRVRVRWDLRSPRVERAAGGALAFGEERPPGAVVVLSGTEEPERVELDGKGEYLLAQIPPSIQEVLTAGGDPAGEPTPRGLARGRTWREALRRIGEHYLVRGRAVAGVCREKDGRTWLVLARRADDRS